MRIEIDIWPFEMVKCKFQIDILASESLKWPLKSIFAFETLKYEIEVDI
jgi:hypothetical protein